MLASDLANPEFANPQNPDKLLHVEFYMYEALDPNKSREFGKPVKMPALPYIRIMKPGDNTSIIETPVREDHKARFPDKWLYFQMQQGMIDGGVDIPGWKIEEWDYLKPEQVHELKFLRFYTVEQIAGASDAQVQRLGIGGLGMREEAKKALKEKVGAGINAELAKKDAEIEALKAGQRETAGKLEQLIALLASERGVKEDPKAEKINQAVSEIAASVTSERDELVAQYVAKFNKKPHHKLGVDKIKAALGE